MTWVKSSRLDERARSQTIEQQLAALQRVRAVNRLVRAALQLANSNAGVGPGEHVSHVHADDFREAQLRQNPAGKRSM